MISGIGGDHLIPAILYRYVITLLFKFMLFHFEFILSSCISNRVQYSCVFSFRFRQVLRAPELVKDNGSPLVDNSMFSAFTRRF